MRNISVKIARALQFIFLVVFLYLCFLIGREIYESRRVCKISVDLLNTYKVQQESDWSGGMLEINADYAGWLEVDGTNISMPVVLGKDNEYYLKHNFYKEENKHGCLFLDFRTELTPFGNLVIYGHNMKDETMFGELDSFKDGDFFEKHSLVKLTAQDGEHFYQLFAAAVIPGTVEDEDYIDLSEWLNTISDDTAEVMLDTLASRAEIWQDCTHTTGQRYLYLVTCDYSRTNGRLLLAAREITEQEES